MQISGLSASNTFSATDVLAIEVNVNGVEKTYKLTGATLATALASIGAYLKTTDVVNNLTSTNTDKPLSAAQGKALNSKITNIVKKETITGTTSSNGELVTDFNWVDDIVSVDMGLGTSQYCVVRKSSSGKLVLFVFSSALQPYANTNVTANVHYIIKET